MHWYAVYTKARAELWARTNLWQRGFEVYLPRYRRRRRHARRIDYVSAPLFPRYLFVRAALETGARRDIVTAPGVSYLVSFGETAAPVADDIIAEIRNREGEDGLIHLQHEFRRGQPVRVIDGALCDRVGLFDCVADGERVIILLDLLGRLVNVKLPAAALVSEH